MLGSGHKYSFGQNCHSTEAGFASNIFADYKSHSVSLFVNSGILPVKLLYFNRRAPPNISTLATHSKQIHSYFTRSAIAGNFYVEISRTNQRFFFSSRIDTKISSGIPSELRQLGTTHFKRKLNELLLNFFFFLFFFFLN